MHTARFRRRVAVHFDRLKRCPQDIRLGTPPAAVSRAHTLAANQPSGAGRVVPSGTNLQYFDDDEPEGEPDISENQGIAVEIEQRPPYEDATCGKSGIRKSRKLRGGTSLAEQKRRCCRSETSGCLN